MAVSKIIYKSSASATPETWMDATTATAAAADIIAPKTAMLADGVVTTGTGTGGNDKALIEGTLESYSNSEVTKVKDYAFKNDHNLQEASFPNAVTVGIDAFNNTDNLRKVNIPSATAFGNSAFAYSRRLTRLSFPVHSTTGNVSYLCRYCKALASVDCGPDVGKLGTQAFSDTTNLTVVILRRTSGVVALQATNTFETNHMSLILMQTGHVYVPTALLSSYQSNTNWSSLYALNQNLFRKLEDYTVDGTTTGALNYAKIWTAHTPDYSITNEVFDGTRVIDTEIQLFDGGTSEFTIVFSVSAIDGAPSGGALFSCENADGYGVHWKKNGSYASSSSVRFNPSATGNNQPIYHNGKKDFIGVLYSSGLNAIAMAFDSTGSPGTDNGYCVSFRRTGTIQTLSETLIIGGAWSSGVATPNWKGTVHWLKVYKSCLNYNEIVDLLGLEDE